jgi:hypothetical protein
MSQTIDKNLVEFSLFNILEDEVIEEGKVMVTSGLFLTGDGCLTIEGMVRIV